MARNLLSENQIKKLFKDHKPEKVERHNDGDGLIFEMRKKGQPRWVFRYTKPSGGVTEKSLGPFTLGDVFTDPARDLQSALKPAVKKPMAAIVTEDDFKELWKAICAYPQKSMRCAMQISALTFQRPFNLRAMEWAELDGKPCLDYPGQQNENAGHEEGNGTASPGSTLKGSFGRYCGDSQGC